MLPVNRGTVYTSRLSSKLVLVASFGPRIERVLVIIVVFRPNIVTSKVEVRFNESYRVFKSNVTITSTVSKSQPAIYTNSI